MFQFKQFSVDQSNCAMKINTDGVLLGALADGDSPEHILDIGTGTGVIALMLAQRFGNADIDAVEIDKLAAATAGKNFSESKFAGRMALYPVGFEQFFADFPDKKYDLIVANPPFYINSLHSLEERKQLAKHAHKSFFERLIAGVTKHLSDKGLCWLVLNVPTAVVVKTLAAENGLYLNKIIQISSFADKAPHREIMAFGKSKQQGKEEQLVIYEAEGVYTNEYIAVLKDFFTIF